MQLRLGVKRALSSAFAAALLFGASEAGANGRFPRSQHLYEYPSNSDRLLLAATYGLVSSDDGGKHWYYICETAFSFYPPPPDPGFTSDPLLQLTANESILAAAQLRITKSTDGACEWTKSFEEADTVVDDIAVAPSNKNIAVALIRFPRQTPAVSRVYETTNGGGTWAPIGMPITNIAFGYTIDVDPKDPNHIMVTGITTTDTVAESGVFVSSTNHGMTWASSPIPKTNIDKAPYIALVHPTDPNKVFVRTDEWVENDDGGYDARDALLYSKDGGKTWTELLRPIGLDGPGAKLYGFALSPDGNTVLAGYGDPVDGSGRTCDRTLTGVYKSSGADYSFGANPMPIYSDLVSCLTWTAKGIYVCATPDGAWPRISFASDISKLNSAGLTKIMDGDKFSGQPPCCAGRSVNACDWGDYCNRFGGCADGSIPATQPDASCPADAGGGGAGGSGPGDASTDRSMGDASTDRSTGGTGGTGGGTGGGAAGTGGSSGTGGATGGSGGATSGTGGSGGSDDSCKCRIGAPSQTRTSEKLTILVGLAAATAWRRSRRRDKKGA
ncbi:MAG: hypothetical protein ABW133_06170 [Polyangiaceae bacterium]